MKIYIAGIESYYKILFEIIPYRKLNWNLITFVALQTPTQLERFEIVKENSKQMLIDSGAFTYQRKGNIDWLKYTENYAEFIKKYNNDNKITGFFEMDVDNIIGYENVLKLRRILEDVSDKIIPVWHRNRGIDEFKKMCENYDYVAITNKSQDIDKNQFKLFVDYAHKHDTRIHGLGISTQKIIDYIPFDSVDNTNWLVGGKFAMHPINRKQMNSNFIKENYYEFNKYSYLKYMELQEKYYEKWKKICKGE